MSESPVETIEVLLVVDDDVLSRLESVIRHLCVGLLDEPVRLTILSSATSRAPESIGQSRVVTLPRTIWPWKRWSAAQLVKQFSIEPPQIVHCFSSALVDLVREWCVEWNSALVVHFTDLVDVQNITGAALLPDTYAIATTPSIERALIAARSELRDQTRVVPVGLPAKKGPSCLETPDRIPAVLVTVPLTRDCGLDLVLRSLQHIVRSGQEVQLFILSNGPAERYFRRMVEQLGLLSFVTFAAQVRDWNAMEDAMLGADFYILPAPRRRFTASRLTAMACGLAILAPRGTTEDYLIDGVTASLFDPDQPQELTERWLALLEDREAARQLAYSALDYVRTYHQASTMATATAWYYREIVTARTAETASPGA